MVQWTLLFGDPLSEYKTDGTNSVTIDIVQPDTSFGVESSELSSDNPAIWETEPKESVDIDIYYEASGCIPLKRNTQE